jgi:tetratricopeptide (TPR) repeat protein
MEYFERAIAADSLYAQAYSGLADAWATMGLYGNMRPLEARERAHAAAMRAIALDPDLSDAHSSLANVLHNFDWDWAGADREYRRAIELNPSNPLPHHHRGHLLAQHGRFDEARREMAQAQQIDPLSIAIALGSASIEYMARDNEAALRELSRAAEVDSNSALLHRLSAGVYNQLGRERDAVSELARSFELRGQPEIGGAIRRAYAAQGIRGTLELLIAGMIRKRESGAYEPAEHIAELYARLGRKDEAFAWLETAYREHDTELNRFKVDPLFDPLRSDPRYADLLRRLKLDEPSIPS